MSNLIEKREIKYGENRATNNLFTEFINGPKNETTNNFEKGRIFSGFLRKKKRFKINVNVVTAAVNIVSHKYKKNDYRYHNDHRNGYSYHNDHRNGYSYHSHSDHRSGYNHSYHRDGYSHHDDDWDDRYREY